MKGYIVMDFFDDRYRFFDFHYLPEYLDLKITDTWKIFIVKENQNEIEFYAWKLHFKIIWSKLKIWNINDESKNTTVEKWNLLKILNYWLENNLGKVKVLKLYNEVFPDENKSELESEKSLKDTLSVFIRIHGKKRLNITMIDLKDIIKLSKKEIIFNFKK